MAMVWQSAAMRVNYQKSEVSGRGGEGRPDSVGDMSLRGSHVERTGDQMTGKNSRALSTALVSRLIVHLIQCLNWELAWEIKSSRRKLPSSASRVSALASSGFDDVFMLSGVPVCFLVLPNYSLCHDSR